MFVAVIAVVGVVLAGMFGIGSTLWLRELRKVRASGGASSTSFGDGLELGLAVGERPDWVSGTSDVGGSTTTDSSADGGNGGGGW